MKGPHLLVHETMLAQLIETRARSQRMAEELAWATLRAAQFARHALRTKDDVSYQHYVGRAEALLEACLRVQDRWDNHFDASHALRWLLRFMDDCL